MQDRIYELLDTWLQLKNSEEQAKALRLQIEEQLNQMIAAPEEGQKTSKFDDLRCTRTNKLIYKVSNLEAYADLAGNLPLGVSLLKPTTDESKVKALRKNADLFGLMAPCLEIKPAKPHYEIVRLS